MKYLDRFHLQTREERQRYERRKRIEADRRAIKAQGFVLAYKTPLNLVPRAVLAREAEQMRRLRGMVRA